jgi:ribosomal protein L17
MNHSTKLKNYNRTASHAKSMFKTMVESFEIHGHVNTTLPKAKRLKSILEANKVEDSIKIVRTGFRKGDNALMAEVMGNRRDTKLNVVEKKSKKSKAKKK